MTRADAGLPLALTCRVTGRLTLVLLISLAPAVAQAQPPPARTAQPAQRKTVTRQSPIFTTTLRSTKDSRIAPDRAKRIQPRRGRVRSVSQQPSSLHILGSSLQSLPPALPPALLNQPTPPPTALRQLQHQLDLLHVRSPH